MEKMNIRDLRPAKFIVPKKYAANALAFLDLYDMEDFMPFPSINVDVQLKATNKRTCRFCGKSSSDVTFKKKAHIIPELLNSHNIISDFECDMCNEISGKYESDLANFLGMTRTFHAVKGKYKVPKYKSNANSIIFQNVDDNSFLISRTNPTDGSIFYNVEDKTLDLKIICNSYIPINVYKALLKIALSILPEKYVSAYEDAFKYITFGNKNFEWPKLIGLTVTPPTYIAKFPVVMLFKKKDCNTPILTHTLCVYFRNFVFQLPIPLYKEDQNLFDGREITIPFCPILCPNEESASILNHLDVYTGLRDLSSSELCKDDEHLLKIPLEEEVVEKLRREHVDSKTGETIVDLNKVVELQIVRSDWS